MMNTPYLLKSIQASIKAGAAILEIYNKNEDFGIEYKADDSPLTRADKQSHEIIVSFLNAFNIPVLSEEGRNVPYEERKTWDRLWIVDPLDGTKEFIKRNDEFTVNIALVENNKPIMGVIYIPVKNTLYYASQDIGAYKIEDNKLIDLISKETESGSRTVSLNRIMDGSVRLSVKQSVGPTYTIVGSRSHSTPELEAFVKDKKKEYDNVEFVSAGSSLKFCLVAEGRADIYPRLGPTMEWDTAAGQVIAENAGASVIRHDTNGPLTYNKPDLLNPWFIILLPHIDAVS